MRTITLEQLKEVMQQKMEINRGDIWMVNIPKEAKKVLGEHIQTGIRPAIIISGEGNNKHSSTFNLLPISSKIHKAVYPHHTLIKNTEDMKACGLSTPSVILTEQYLTLGRDKFIKKLGKAPQRLAQEVDTKQLVQQGLNSRRYFNWNNAFKQIKMLLKVRNKDTELYNYFTEQLQDSCEKYSMNINFVLEKYKQHCSVQKQQRRTNIYEPQYKIDRKVKKNIGHLAMQNCYAQA